MTKKDRQRGNLICGGVILAYFAMMLWLMAYGYDLITSWIYIEPLYALGGLGILSAGVIGAFYGYDRIMEEVRAGNET